MATLVPENHPALHTIAEEITAAEFTNGTVAKLIKDLKAALRTYSVDGLTPVAIAAPQIGISKRLFLVDDQSTDRDPLPSFVAINPQIVKQSRKTHLVDEGCLSIPEQYGRVSRHTKVTLRALDENGDPFERGASDLLAQIIQHENDHLDGILFTERAVQLWSIAEEQARHQQR